MKQILTKQKNPNKYYQNKKLYAYYQNKNKTNINKTKQKTNIITVFVQV